MGQTRASILGRVGAAFRAFRSAGSDPIRQTTAAGTADTPANEGKFRRLGEARRDLVTYKQEQAIDVAYALVRENPIVGRLVAFFDEWTVGDGMTVRATCEDEGVRERLQEAIDEVLEDPQTNWCSLQHEIPRALWPMGELLSLVFPPSGGRGDTGIGIMDPARIQQVLVNPQNARQTMGVLVKPAQGAGKPTLCMEVAYREWLASLSGVEAPLSAVPAPGGAFTIPSEGGNTSVVVGPDCIYSPHGRMVGATRGTPGLYAIADDLDAYSAACWQMQEAVAVRNAVAGILSHAPGQEGTAKALVDKLNAGSGKGGVFHAISTQLTLDMKAAGLGAMDFQQYHATQIARLSAATGIPPTFWGDATSAGNSSTTELAATALRAFKAYQAEVREIFRTLIRFQLRSKGLEMGIPEENLGEFEVILPDVGGREALRNAAAVGQIANFIDLGKGVAWNEAKAGAMLRRQASELLDETFEDEDIPTPEEIEARKAVAAPPGPDADPGAQADEMARLKKAGQDAAA